MVRFPGHPHDGLSWYSIFHNVLYHPNALRLPRQRLKNTCISRSKPFWAPTDASMRSHQKLGFKTPEQVEVEFYSAVNE